MTFAMILAAVALSAAPPDGLRGARADGVPTGEAEALVEVPAPPPPPLIVSGSSTVAPFALVAAGRLSGETVDVTATGTTAGLSALCDLRPGSADLTGASRAITEDELAACLNAEVPTVIEVTLGRDGIVLAQAASQAEMALEPRDLYRALAARLPDEACTMLPNRTRRWTEVRADLPDRPIRVFGPPMTSGTLEVFVREAIAAGARTEPCLAALERRDEDAFAATLALRSDGAWTQAGESDGAIAYAVTRLPGAIGVFGMVHAAPQEGLALLPFGGVHPNARTVADGRYPLSRPLFLYTTAGHLTRDPRVIEVVRAFTSTDAAGPSGRLTQMGLIAGAESGQARLIDTRSGTATPLPLGR